MATSPRTRPNGSAEVPQWTHEEGGTRLVRRWTVKTYAQAFALVTRISALAEAERHHPDIRLGWGYCDVSLHTHAIGGLHRNDFILAAKIDTSEAVGSPEHDAENPDPQSA